MHFYLFIEDGNFLFIGCDHHGKIRAFEVICLYYRGARFIA